MSPESRLTLERWEKQMIAELGEDGFRLYKDTLFANGANLHTNIQCYLSGKPDEEIKILPANEGHWASMEPVFSCISDVVCLEQPVRHSELQYCGVLDCVADYRGHRHVIEWKTSKRRKANIKYTFDNPLQVVAYLGAFNCQPSTQLQVERCMLVIGYDDGTLADVHVMDKWECLNYWTSWLQRLHLYRMNNQPIIKSPIGSLPCPELTGHASAMG
jgi:genome maintenance exonuclease 1